MIRKAGGSEMVNVVYLMKHTQIINLQSPTKKKTQTKYLERAIFQSNWTAYPGTDIHRNCSLGGFPSRSQQTLNVFTYIILEGRGVSHVEFIDSLFIWWIHVFDTEENSYKFLIYSQELVASLTNLTLIIGLNTST